MQFHQAPNILSDLQAKLAALPCEYAIAIAFVGAVVFACYVAGAVNRGGLR